GSRSDIAAGFRAGNDLANRGGQPLQPATEHAVIIGGPGVLRDSPRGPTDPGRETGVHGCPSIALAPGFPGLAPGVRAAVEVVGERDYGDLRVGHDAGGVLSLRRLAVQVGHRARIPGIEPAIELC